MKGGLSALSYIIPIVFYRERDGARALRAYHTRDLRLQQAGA